MGVEVPELLVQLRGFRWMGGRGVADLVGCS